MTDEIEWRRAVWEAALRDAPQKEPFYLPDPPRPYGPALPPDILVHPDEAQWIEEVGNLLVPRVLPRRVITQANIAGLEGAINSHLDALRATGELRPNFPRVRLHAGASTRVDMQLVPRGSR